MIDFRRRHGALHQGFAEINSMNQKLDDMQSKTVPENFEFSNLIYKIDDPSESLKIILADLITLTTGAAESPKKGSLLKSLSQRGSHITGAVKEAVRDASPLKRSKKDKGSRSGSGNVTPQRPDRATSADLPKPRDDEKAPLLSPKPAAKPAAVSSSSAPLNVAPKAGLLFDDRSLGDPNDKVKLYQPGQIKNSQVLFSTFYDKGRDLMTISCSDDEFLRLIEESLNEYVNTTRFDAHNIRFKYDDLAKKNLNLNRILPIDLRGLPEAMAQSVQSTWQTTTLVKKPPTDSINNDPDDEKKSSCCSWLRCCS